MKSSATACVGFPPRQHWHPGMGDQVGCSRAGTVLAGGTLSNPQY